MFDTIDVLDQIAAETGKTVSQVALRWVLQRPSVVNIVVGARNEAQLKENLGAVGWSLNEGQMARLDTASEVRPIYPYWHQRQFGAHQSAAGARDKKERIRLLRFVTVTISEGWPGNKPFTKGRPMLTRTARRYVIASSIVVFLMVLYTVAGFWAVPHFLRSGVTDFVSTHYGRKVALGDIRFNPYTFTLDITDFALPDSDGQPMVGFGRLHVDLEAELVSAGAEFSRDRAREALIRAVIRGWELNLADLGKGFASSPRRRRRLRSLASRRDCSSIGSR